MKPYIKLGDHDPIHLEPVEVELMPEVFRNVNWHEGCKGWNIDLLASVLIGAIEAEFDKWMVTSNFGAWNYDAEITRYDFTWECRHTGEKQFEEHGAAVRLSAALKAYRHVLKPQGEKAHRN